MPANPIPYAGTYNGSPPLLLPHITEGTQEQQDNNRALQLYTNTVLPPNPANNQALTTKVNQVGKVVTQWGNYVQQLVAGTNVTLSPSGGQGIVTVNATGGTGVKAANEQIDTFGTPSWVAIGGGVSSWVQLSNTITKPAGVLVSNIQMWVDVLLNPSGAGAPTATDFFQLQGHLYDTSFTFTDQLGGAFTSMALWNLTDPAQLYQMHLSFPMGVQDTNVPSSAPTYDLYMQTSNVTALGTVTVNAHTTQFYS